MENEINQNRETETKEFSLSIMAISYLQNTAPWIKFFSILGFIGSGLLVFIAVSLFFIPIPFPAPVPIKSIFAPISFGYLVIAIITFFPSFYLLKYSNKLLKTKYAEDVKTALENAFLWQKRYWVFIGIIMIVYIGIVIIAITGVLIAIFALKAF